jgi:regulator of protease activity HflC (stomatin/prohibitin superfamily)
VTVDEGYAAVTQDNGQQKILEGGQAYMLTHRNWRFEKFITKKLQTNDVGPIKVTTGDNVPLETTATVNWRIEDVQLAARMAANTMPGTNAVSQDAGGTQFDISKLRQDVLRQVTASLAAFVGSLSYAAHGHAVMAAQVSGTSTRKEGGGEPEPEEKEGAKALFDRTKLIGSVEHANEICSQYGVKILSINLISAYPADRQLLEALSQGAVATVAAEQTETAARGEAQALLTKAKAEAEAERIRAEGHAAAEEIKAEGSLKAARNLESSEVAVNLAKLRTAGECLGEGRANSFFFGLGGPAEIPSGVLGSALMAEASMARAR